MLLVTDAFFLGLVAGPANPFTTTSVALTQGAGPNVLLQDNPLVAIHPPLIYTGLVLFIDARSRSSWARSSRGAWVVRGTSRHGAGRSQRGRR